MEIIVFVGAVLGLIALIAFFTAQRDAAISSEEELRKLSPERLKLLSDRWHSESSRLHEEWMSYGMKSKQPPAELEARLAEATRKNHLALKVVRERMKQAISERMKQEQ